MKRAMIGIALALGLFSSPASADMVRVKDCEAPMTSSEIISYASSAWSQAHLRASCFPDEVMKLDDHTVIGVTIRESGNDWDRIEVEYWVNNFWMENVEIKHGLKNPE